MGFGDGFGFGGLVGFGGGGGVFDGGYSLLEGWLSGVELWFIC